MLKQFDRNKRGMSRSYCLICSNASPVLSLPFTGLLHSTTTSGMPFTCNTTSAIRDFSVLTRNWFVTVNRLFFGLTKSITRSV
ncbi:hypothetical protein CHKEEEPN_4934 [Methylorubrum podarium]|nr:hypothetical protein CHKEEEPN_4934 [Methylorubrum podarium]